MEKIWIEIGPETRTRDGIMQVAVWTNQIPDIIDDLLDTAGIDATIEYHDDEEDE